MRSYRTINRVCGWVSFILAAIVYTLTVEPSASFWDCPEFILSAAKLEVGHPPGAPFFMLTGNVISQLAGDPAQIALLINIMNALLSAGCILFLFWTITHLTRLLIAGNGDGENLRPEQIFLVMGCGFAGALVYTFSDTFWFSAVEGEVYAFSSFFTAVAFWLMLRWEEEADSPRSDRWLILLAYLIGLSIGVHLLNLLCIPAAGLLFYYRKWKQPTLKGTLLALFLSCLLVAFVLYGIVPGVMKVAGQFELALVNGLHAAYNSGMLLYVLLLMGVLIWSCAESIRSSHPMRMSSLSCSVSCCWASPCREVPFYRAAFSHPCLRMSLFAPALSQATSGRSCMAHTSCTKLQSADDDRRLFVVCRHSDPVGRQYTDGPAITRRPFHAQRLSGA